MWKFPSLKEWNTSFCPSGDQAGSWQSPNSSVILLASPPSAGRVHKVPCKAITMVDSSGERATAIFVPSDTFTCRLSWLCAGEEKPEPKKFKKNRKSITFLILNRDI